MPRKVHRRRLCRRIRRPRTDLSLYLWGRDSHLPFPSAVSTFAQARSAQTRPAGPIQPLSSLELPFRSLFSRLPPGCPALLLQSDASSLCTGAWDSLAPLLSWHNQHPCPPKKEAPKKFHSPWECPRARTQAFLNPMGCFPSRLLCSAGSTEPGQARPGLHHTGSGLRMPFLFPG